MRDHRPKVVPYHNHRGDEMLEERYKDSVAFWFGMIGLSFAVVVGALALILWVVKYFSEKH